LIYANNLIIFGVYSLVVKNVINSLDKFFVKILKK